MFGQRLRTIAFASLLLVVALTAPLVAYAGVTAVWPGSDQTAAVATSPPVSFAAGSDHSAANTAGFAGAFTEANDGASYTLTLSGLSGGNLTVDDLVTITANSAVSTFKLEIDTALTGTLTNPTVFKMRLWTGGTAPTADNSAGVCAVLDLEATAGTETAATCAGNQSVKVQVVYVLPDSASGSSTVTIRPSSVAFA